MILISAERNPCIIHLTI